MSMRIFSAIAASTLVLLLSACSREPDNARLAEVEREQMRSAAAAGRVACALGGAPAFRQNCTMDRLTASDGQMLVLGRADAGYRRFRITGDGRGLVAADGASPAVVTILDDGVIEVAVEDDRYRLPATIGPVR